MQFTYFYSYPDFLKFISWFKLLNFILFRNRVLLGSYQYETKIFALIFKKTTLLTKKGHFFPIIQKGHFFIIISVFLIFFFEQI